MQVSRQKILEFTNEDLGLIATADAGTYPDEVVLAVWEELAARGVVVEFIEQQEVPSETPDLVTVATFRNYVQAQFTQSRLLSSGMTSFLFDDNTIRIDCSCPQHSVASNCACPPAIPRPARRRGRGSGRAARTGAR